MTNNLLIILSLVFILGVGLGYVIRYIISKRKTETAEQRAQEMIEDAKRKEKEIVLEAKDKALKIIDEAKKEEKRQKEELNKQRRKLEERESLFDRKLLELEDKFSQLSKKEHSLEKERQEIESIKKQELEKLQNIAQMSKDEALEMLLKRVENEYSEDIMNRIRKLEKGLQEEYDKKAKHILVSAMERCASSVAVETTISSLTIPNDDMKGRIIGKDGRNIKTIEQLTGVEIIVDDTPETIFISGFSPIRRQLAKLALEKLMVDGRIHPGRIEEMVEAAKVDLARDIRQAGEEAVYELGIVGLDPKLVQILGRLKYRTSYGHNVLQHSKEVAYIASFIAAEIGADVSVAKKGGLLHDIGKALDHEVQGGHPQIGYDIMKKFGLPEEIAYISLGHHEDNPKTLEAVVVKAADAISGARPGARKDTYEQYVQRLEELEGVASSFEGVKKVYAIYAGREIRVFVEPEQIDDLTAKKLAKNIASKIEAELKYPGEIKVTLIREMRIIEYAK